jgi:hypothetical protein
VFPEWVKGEPHSAPLDSLGERALEHLDVALAYLEWKRAGPVVAPESRHRAALWDPALRPLGEALHRVAEAFVKRIVRSGHAAELRAACDELATLNAGLPVSDSQLAFHLAEADAARSSLLLEYSLDQHDAWVVAGESSSGRLVGAWMQADVRFADTWLTLRALEAAYAWAARDELFRSEIAICRWVYSIWGGLRESIASDALLRARIHRELEFMLAERRALAFGELAVSAMCDRVPAGVLSRRQAQLLLNHAGSIAGMWLVKRRKGELVWVEEMASGEQLHMVEHRKTSEYGAHDYIIGRLIPQPAGHWVRSAAAMMWRPADAADARSLFELTARHSRIAERTLVTEGAIQTIGDPAARIPEHFPAATTPEDAARQRSAFLEALQSRGLTRAAAMTEKGRATGEIGSLIDTDVSAMLWLWALEKVVHGTSPLDDLENATGHGRGAIIFAEPPRPPGRP